MPPGKVRAPLSHHGFVTLRQPSDELIEPRRAGRADHLIQFCVGSPQCDVFLHGPVEDERVLRDQGDPISQGRQREVIQVDPVDQDPAAGGAVEAHQELQERRFARAALAHDCHGLAGRDAHAELLQHVPPVAVSEADVVDTHVARLSQRLRLTRHSDAEKIERDLMKVVPREHWANWSHWLIWHGRRRCYARKPDCGQCEIFRLCPSGKIYLRTGVAKKSEAANG